jgi:hypothetical protein
LILIPLFIKITYTQLRLAHHPTPKENNKKKGQKKRKKKATISSGEDLGCQGFWKKYYLLQYDLVFKSMVK